jgi:glycosyltransferase involved in cell wall biosynthesis
LRILEVVHNFPPFSRAGTELYTLHLSKALQSLGHEVAVVHPVHNPDRLPLSFQPATFEGLTVYQFNAINPSPTPCPDFLNPAFDEPFAAFLTSRHFDIAHFQHLVWLSANWPAVARRQGLKTVLKVDDLFFPCPQFHLTHRGGGHCSGPESLDKCFDCMFPGLAGESPDKVAGGYQQLAFRRALLQKVFASFDWAHTPSRFAQVFHARFGFFNPRLTVLSTGIQPFEVLPRRADPAGQVRVAFLGQLIHRKGLHHFLEAIQLFRERARESGPRRRLRFSIRGDHPDDDYARGALARIGQLPEVEYGGPFGPEDRAALFAEIDLLVVPSLGENYPFIIREALLAGLPVAASAIAGVPEIITHNTNGFLFRPGDVAALASLFLALEQDPGLLQRLEPGSTPIKTIDQEAEELSGALAALV